LEKSEKQNTYNEFLGEKARKSQERRNCFCRALFIELR